MCGNVMREMVETWYFERETTYAFFHIVYDDSVGYVVEKGYCIIWALQSWFTIMVVDWVICVFVGCISRRSSHRWCSMKKVVWMP